MEELLQLRPDVEINKFDTTENGDDYIISFNDRNWKVSAVVYLICCQISDTPTTAEKLIGQSINGLVINEKSVEEVVNFLKTNGMLVGTETQESTKKRNLYLWARITLLPAKVVEKLCCLSVLFKKPCFVTLCVVCAVFFGIMMVMYPSAEVSAKLQALKLYELIILYVIVFFIGLFHEFGHSAALMHYGERPRRIGVAVYFIMPVLFSDVTNAWKLKRWQRCIVDLGGIYFQLIISLVLYVINALWIKEKILETAIVFSMLEIINNLNPFIKMDGFWIVCDGLGISNPIPFVVGLITEPFRKEKKMRLNAFSTRYRVAIYAYAVATIVFLVYFSLVLIKSVILAVKIVSADIVRLVSETGSYAITFSDVLTYLSERITTFIILIFVIRLVVRGISAVIRRFCKAK